MTVYKVGTPDGKTYKFEGPEGLSEQQVLDFGFDILTEQGILGGIQEPLIEQPKQPKEQESSGFFRRAISDPLLSLGQGVVGLKEAAVGIADIPTLGRAGKVAEAVEAALPPKIGNLSQTLQELKSPELQAAEQKVAEAEGFTDTAKAYLKNPSSIPVSYTHLTLPTKRIV